MTTEQFFFYIAKFCLLPSNEAIALIIIIGLFSRYRTYFAHALYLLFFSIIFNSLLKVIFQIPLDPKLNLYGYAFPSGHMQVSAAFYSYFILSFRNIILRFLLILILAGIGFGLIYLGFHNFIDVFGGLIIGIISTMIYKRCEKATKIEKIGGTLFYVTSITLLVLHHSYMIKVNAWFAYVGIIILTLIIFVINNRKIFSV